MSFLSLTSKSYLGVRSIIAVGGLRSGASILRWDFVPIENQRWLCSAYCKYYGCRESFEAHELRGWYTGQRFAVCLAQAQAFRMRWG